MISPTQTSLSSPTIAAIKTYIRDRWQRLSRSHDQLLDAAYDEKIEHERNGLWLVYISGQEDSDRVIEHLQKTVPPEDMEKISIRSLPLECEQIESHGLLYLPGEYVVPGGRFNELYGWDSYFILLGLMHDQEYALAKSLIEQLLYEVKHYGTVLNANRTYYLNRSQPPLLSRMVLEWYGHCQDADWLLSTLPQLESYYYYWVVPPHLNQATGLSRYFAVADGPAPEVLYSEIDDQGRSHFDRVKEFYRDNTVTDYDVSLYYDREQDELTELFYTGDRAMRESGFDPTDRFGPFSVDIIHYAPVCLNVLLHQVEQDLAQIHDILGNTALADQWRDRSDYRKGLIDKYLWNDEKGFYLDYNFRERCHCRYEYATAFYPLWAGIASPEQAQRLVDNLPQFEAPGGFKTSNVVSGNQWDAPFGWAPFQYFVVKGLLRYGYKAEALRLAEKFVSLLVKDFERCGVLLEKYDIEACTGDVSGKIKFGYNTNEVGFGWTNAVFLELLTLLEQEQH
ncbi:trehalase family glycosidase [Nodosilinea sp. E11]|uniref:trehalase family glycosidase n=1 Tax=Nodosilinea sp. E11 TaxID=3037479 RepID=UPI0029352783|nr:trehalase family glycosidase [Nodosilinea sp. E11]WOD41142.1 trehalase family glycosidase [Nodosilinea sp. E11]